MEAESANHLMVAAPAQVHYLHEDVATQHQTLLLKTEKDIIAGDPLNNIPLRILVKFLVPVRIEKLGLQSERILYSRQVFDYQVLQQNPLRTPDRPRQQLLVVEYVPQLGWLRDSAPVAEPLPAVVCDRILGSVSKATEHQVTANKRASSALARIAVHIYHILRIFLKKLHDIITGISE